MVVVTDATLPVLLKFINQNSDVVDIQWDRRMSPRLLLNPYTEYTEEKRRVAQYLLMIAAICEDRMVGFSENARRILILLHQIYGDRIFEIRKPHMFAEKIVTSGFYDDLGPSRDAISPVLINVNDFVKNKAGRNLLEYSKRFSKPKDLVDDLSANIERMNGPYRDKAWVYLRWMVRSEPDLRIFDHFSPAELFVPLTQENANVATSLGLINSASPSLWRDEERAKKARESVTNFARQLFPNDPARVDYPFFLLGRWLAKKNLNRNTLKDALEFFDHMHKETGRPQAYYQKLSRYKSGWEKKTAIILRKLNLSYGYEPVSFPLPGEIYTPDFILNKEIDGRKIILEPHYFMTPHQSAKYSLFKRTYGHEFILVLLLKNDLISYYNQRNILNDEVCDDVWPIEFVDLLAEKIRTGTYDPQAKDNYLSRSPP
ncbi:MAG TPA: DUF2400 family protein [Candidatus Sulfotelmatobacter sp.]|nr:DUF2400 family protein [Candidatus Sulfotelmatobacter sp.]